MRKVRKIIIVSTRVRSFVVRHADSTNSWCPVCQAYELMVSPAAAAAAYMQPVRTIYRWLEDGKLHCTDYTADLQICLASLRAGETEEITRR